jgi:hypothetical protein
MAVLQIFTTALARDKWAYLNYRGLAATAGYHPKYLLQPGMQAILVVYRGAIV